MIYCCTPYILGCLVTAHSALSKPLLGKAVRRRLHTIPTPTHRSRNRSGGTKYQRPKTATGRGTDGQSCTRRPQIRGDTERHRREVSNASVVNEARLCKWIGAGRKVELRENVSDRIFHHKRGGGNPSSILAIPWQVHPSENPLRSYVSLRSSPGMT